MVESIRENVAPARLPECCNLGVWLRVLLAVNGGALLVAFARGDTATGVMQELAATAAVLEPVAFASLLALCACRPVLARMAYAPAAALSVLIVLAACSLVHALFTLVLPAGADVSIGRALVWSAVAAGLLLAYFDLFARAHSPALAEARLMALTARIRPHFLFNSLNAVLGVLRADPRRAERALEELADLFRVLMRENRELVPLSDEIALARQYLELERLRLGERLRVRWEIERCPADALVPPLMLQPLLENAVYHGIEPAQAPGEVHVRLDRAGERVRIELSNPCSANCATQPGNRMALANIRERLMLFYDLEARLDTEVRDDIYRVTIELPYRRGP